MGQQIVLVAPASFKGSVTAVEAAAAMAAGVAAADASLLVRRMPLADGGEGTVAALVEAAQGELVTVAARGPLGQPVSAVFGLLASADGPTAVIEMAAASGLPLLRRDQYDPLRTTTHGTGDLIRAALDRGCRRILIGVGGSATVDGGAGMAEALGVRLVDAAGQPLSGGGGILERVDRLDISGLDPRLSGCEITILSDVRNPLLGPRGAAAVYGPQKGATPTDVEVLERGLARWAQVLRAACKRDVAMLAGAGAAGGLGAGLVALLNAQITSGSAAVLRAVGFAEAVRSAALVITGEGQIDDQTADGKVIVGVADLARAAGVPVVALAGTVTPAARALYAHGVVALHSIVSGPMSLDDAQTQARALIANATEQAVRVWRAGGRQLPVDPAPSPLARVGTIQRATNETEVLVRWNLDGEGRAAVQTGVGFFDHMLTHLAHHGLYDIEVSARGDLHVDAHHTIEDVALALGRALHSALGERRGIQRMGQATVPMDEALVMVAVDLSGRPWTVCDLPFTTAQIGGFPTDMVAHFLASLASEGRFNLHATLLHGSNDHHIAEATFKALARALCQATGVDVRRRGAVASTKGTLVL